VGVAGLDITVHASDQRRAPGHLSRQGPSALRWALLEAAQCARRPGSPDYAHYQEAAKRLGGNRACPVDRAQTAQTLIPHAATARRGGPATRMTSPVRTEPFVTPTRRGQLPPSSCRHPHLDGHHRPSGRNASPSGITPSTIMSLTRNHPGSRTEIRLGARGHDNSRPDRAHAPQPSSTPTIEPRTALDKRRVHR
jgi:hypothetical protein